MAEKFEDLIKSTELTEESQVKSLRPGKVVLPKPVRNSQQN